MTASDQKELNAAQSIAAFTIDRHVSVTAGPGSGKTTVLVERYLHILRARDVSVDQIVAITFTNRAANEMRTRLRRALDRLMRSAGPDERAKWLRHKRTLDGAVITTFHGFCARLLREFPVEAEIDPQFALMDETQSAMLIEGVMEEVLTELINSGHDIITRLVVGVGRGAVANAAVRIYRAMRNQGLTPHQIEEAIDRSHPRLELYSELFQQTDALMNEFIALNKTTPAVEKKRSAAASLWPKLRDKLAAIPESGSLAEYCQTIEQLRAAARPIKSGKITELVATLDELMWGDSGKDPYGKLPKTCFDFHARTYAHEMIEIIQRAEQRLEEKKRQLAALDFDDLIVRVLKLFYDRPDVLDRIAVRYRFFLVDEFQDTNTQQRELMQRLAISSAQHANLFIVGDRKQSIYGFRGADVDVFRAMTEEIATAEGLSHLLETNFRSQAPLIEFFNHLFGSAFQAEVESTQGELHELGYVAHEASVAHREADDETPIVEVLIDAPGLMDEVTDEATVSHDTSRERDAKQIASRILTLVEDEGRFAYRDFSLLFRAMSNVSVYESVFRRLGIPYHTVQGKGFYAREEITDLLQLLKFLDNLTDEIALAAVLRSPLCGLSDDALLALRCAPALERRDDRVRMKPGESVRDLLEGLTLFELLAFINDDERAALEKARRFLSKLIEKRNRLPLADLLRLAVEESEFLTVTAANFDGAQRLSNIWKLFELADRFEKSGANLIRDFVQFVEDFERAGGRESEGQIDESADAVLLMSVHQSKGQEFRVVVIPDMTREVKVKQSDWFMLDRNRGLTLKIPDGRGGMVAGNALEDFRERAQWRELFESMRLFYVAATRAMDRLIVSGASRKQIKLDGKSDSWLKWVITALDIGGDLGTGIRRASDRVEVNVFANLASAISTSDPSTRGKSPSNELLRLDSNSIGDQFQLLGRLEPERTPFVDESTDLPGELDKRIKLRRALHRFSVTQLVDFQRCPRQYFFDRILNTPAEEQLDTWNSEEMADTSEDRTARLRGAVVHRFCETFTSDMDVYECLSISFDSVFQSLPARRRFELGLSEREAAIRSMIGLADNYVKSDVFKRIDAARADELLGDEKRVYDERKFVIRRPLGSLSGTMDKIILSGASDSTNKTVEIIDFKTNRFPKRKVASNRKKARQTSERALFEGMSASDLDGDLQREIEEAATDYILQMQAYALAARELIPNLVDLRVTIHFLDPDIESAPSKEILEYDLCARAIDNAMAALLSSASDHYPTRVAEHCNFCNFRRLCPDGQAWVRAQVRD